MNANDVLRYGHLTLLATLDALPAGQAEAPGVCGVWSAKDVVAHLASYELLLAELLEAFVAGRQQAFVSPMDAAFNDEQVARRRSLSLAEARDEYERAYGRVSELIGQVPAEQRRQAGELPWYGAEYDLEDYLVYAFYGHKREHSAQIAAFCDRLRPAG
jgi:hypothetical protein